ncbi:hypothetical protein BHE90_017598 [Fusarium euwallaceae]|uniref:Uncharacterized protein n=1 Tax=Fusarium euwallaceae TaxID=1147111 RepID=A0A430KWY4_9HYPO|nr:hypothetical protein BHE90_017598 [Fusarium euwallaceae]
MSPHPAVIAVSVGAVALIIALVVITAIWRKPLRKLWDRWKTPTTTIGGRHDDYSTSEAGLVPPELQQAQAATIPMESPVQLQETKHFHVAVLVSNAADWLKRRNLSVSEQNTVMDRGCNYSLYINPLLMKKGENGDLVAPPESDSKEIFAVKSTKALAQIDGILMHEFIAYKGMAEPLNSMDLPKMVMSEDPEIPERCTRKWKEIFVRDPWVFLQSWIENPEGTAQMIV